jgi:tetratricopeptide (TPR) repeat protein
MLLFTLLLCAASSAFAQNASEFYLGLLRRGTSYAEAGQYDAAATPLRIAAFGLVETVDKYETALAYLAITHDRLGNQDAARDSIRRIVAAERVERKFGSLPLPATIRTAFDVVVKKHLSPAEVSALASGAPIAQPPRTQPVTTTRPAPTIAQQSPAQDPAAQTETKPAPATTPEKPESSTSKPATTKPAPATTKPSPTPTAPPKAEVKPEPKKPEPKPAEPKPAPATTRPQTTPPPAIKPPAQPSAQATTTPATTTSVAQAQTKSPLSAKDLAAHMAAAERALAGAQLTEARRHYREILESPGLDRDSTLRVAEGFYRSRDFAGALAAFKALGALKRGEEPYGYYHAVSLYETGAYDAARKVLTAAIPYIEMTPDVVRYRAKIEGAR